MNHLYLSGKCIECCVILTEKSYHIKRIDNLSLMLYQTKRSESHPRILSLRNELKVSLLNSVTPNEVRGLLQLHQKIDFCLSGVSSKGVSFLFRLSKRSPPHPVTPNQKENLSPALLYPERSKNLSFTPCHLQRSENLSSTPVTRTKLVSFICTPVTPNAAKVSNTHPVTPNEVRGLLLWRC